MVEMHAGWPREGNEYKRVEWRTRKRVKLKRDAELKEERERGRERSMWRSDL